jgi:hypothetical protein
MATRALNLLLVTVGTLASAAMASAAPLPWSQIPAFRYVCKSRAGVVAQFAFDPQLQPPVSAKVGDGPIDRLPLSAVTAHYDLAYHQKDEFGYDLPQSKRPIILQLMRAGKYGIIKDSNYDTGTVLTVETDGRPNGTGASRDFYNCIEADKTDIE